MKRILKWVAFVIGALAVVAFLLFLYFIPPFTLLPPEAFVQPGVAAAPSLEGIADGSERLLAERGKYIVTSAGCVGCHVPNGSNGPNWTRYLAGGVKFIGREGGAIYSRNITPDVETGIGRYSVEEIAHVIKTGQFHDGRIMKVRGMPWAPYSNWTDEDLYAVATYLHHLNPVRSIIPDQSAGELPQNPLAAEEIHLEDHSTH